jgi:hypothetical protein
MTDHSSNTVPDLVLEPVPFAHSKSPVFNRTERFKTDEMRRIIADIKDRLAGPQIVMGESNALLTAGGNPGLGNGLSPRSSMMISGADGLPNPFQTSAAAVNVTTANAAIGTTTGNSPPHRVKM